MFIDIDALRQLSAELQAKSAIITDEIKTLQDGTGPSWLINRLVGQGLGLIDALDLINDVIVETTAKYLRDKEEHDHARDCHASDFLPY